jgi:putative heme-binding domain-containing protein
MRTASLKEAPAAWAEALAPLFATPESPVANEAAAAAAALSFEDRPKRLAEALAGLAENDSFPLEVRLQALAAMSAGRSLAPVQFALVLEGAAAPYPAGASAASILARAKLSPEQLLALAERLKILGPIQLSALLPAFEQASGESVGLALAAALREARGLAGLHADRVRQLFARYPENVREQGRGLAALLDADAAKQAAHLEEMLPKLKGGDIRRGQAIFNSDRAACASCHAIGYLGGTLGPDLTRIGQVRTERDLLEAIVYPSASFVRSYEPVIVATRAGEDHSGVLRRDAPEEVVLATGPGAEVRIARGDIAEMRPGRLSVMPQGLDEQLSLQEMADLLAFLRATR